MSINLEKGQKIDLTKNQKITKINVGLGWDAVKHGTDVDCDVSCALLDKSDHLVGTIEKSVVYFGNLKLPGIKHSGDNLTGDGDGDDETLQIDLSEVQSKVEKLVVFMNIYRGSERNQSMKDLKNAFIRIYNPLDGNKELCKFNLDDSKGTSTGLIAGEIYRKDNEWKFAAIGESVKDADFIKNIVTRWE